MSYEYTVNIPADKRSTFRAMVKMMGGSLSRARKVEESEIPNATTLAAMEEAKAGINLESVDAEHFLEYVAAL